MCQPCELLYTCYLLTCYLLLLLLLPFNGLFSRTVCVSRYQKGKTGVDLNEARDDGVSFRMAVASAGLYANNLHLAPDRKHLITQFFTGRMRDLTTGTRCTCPRRDGRAARGWLARQDSIPANLCTLHISWILFYHSSLWLQECNEFFV